MSDPAIDSVINAALREVQRYIDSLKFITIPYSRCIDLKDYKVNAVASVFRTVGLGDSDTTTSGISSVDPMWAAQWQLLGTGSMLNFNNYLSNYAAYNTMLQIRNTTSTDLAFIFDKHEDKLYINTSIGEPTNITIAYIPRFDSVEEVFSDYWIDVIIRLSVALAKVTLGRIRTRYNQSNALWTSDGDTILAEGNAELTQLREELKRDTALQYPID